MNRAFRFFFGPMGFFMFTIGFCAEYMKYARATGVVAEVLTIMSIIVLVLAIPTLCGLLYQSMKHGDESPLALWPVARAAFLVNVLTHGTAKLWLWMATDHPSFGVFVTVAAFTVLTIVLLPVALYFLVKAFGKMKEKKVDLSVPEKPIKVGKPKRFKSLSGEWLETTTTYYKKRVEVTTVAVAG